MNGSDDDDDDKKAQNKFSYENGDYTFQPHQKPDKIEDRLLLDSLDEISYNGLFNFFSDPNPSFRNLIMNTGFVSNANSFLEIVLLSHCISIFAK